MTSKLLFSLLVAIVLTYGEKPTLLIIHPDGFPVKKFEHKIHKSINKKIVLHSVLPLNKSEIENILASNSTRLVIVIDPGSISIMKELHSEEYRHRHIPTIFIGSQFNEHLNANTLKNSSTIKYRINLDQYINNAYQLTGSRPQRIGIIYSASNLKLVQSLKNDGERLHARLFPYAISASNNAASVKAFINNMVEINNIDLLIIPNDPLVMNSRNINTFWNGQIGELQVPIAIPPAFLNNISRRDNVFGLVQDLDEITDYASKIITNAHSNNWKISHYVLHAFKSTRLLPENNSNKTLIVENEIKTPLSSTNESVPSIRPEITHNVNVQENKITSSRDKKAKVVTRRKPIKTRPVAQAALKIPQKATTHETANVISGKKVIKDPGKIKKHLKIRSETVMVYREMSPGTTVLGIARCGDNVGVYSDDSTWLHVNFFGIPGYIAMNDVKSDMQQASPANVVFPTIISLSTFILLLINFVIYMVFHHNRRTGSDSMLKRCLLITDRNREITFSSTNKKFVSIYKFLRNFGYHVTVLKNSHSLHDYLTHHRADLILFDFSIDHYIRSIIFQTLLEGGFSQHLTLLFYNVKNTKAIKNDFRFIQKTFVFNDKFTISDLSKVLLMTSVDNDKSLSTGAPGESYLEGIFHKDTLTEIFSMIDSNRKTGCLLVETTESSGMVFFEEGTITYAISNTLMAEEALFSILSQKTGSFRFISDKKPVSQHVNLDVQSVLLEKARIEDETTHVAIEQLMKEYSPGTSAIEKNRSILNV